MTLSVAAAAGKNGSAAAAAASSGEYDYDLLIIGAGVGGHGAALHAVECVSCCGGWLAACLALGLLCGASSGQSAAPLL